MSKTDTELKQLAADIYDNKVFTDRHIRGGGNDLQMIFLPIALGAFSDMKKKEREKVSLIYEYISKAGPRSINGYPIFMSVNYLTKEEHNRMNTFYEAYKQIKDSFLK